MTATTRRVQEVALPRRRYVPGTMRHPRHSSEPWLPSFSGTIAPTVWSDRRWLYGLDLFDASFYWEAHEVWEDLWHTLARTDDDARVVQGMIQLAASLLTAELGRESASQRLRARAKTKLNVATQPAHPAYTEVVRAWAFAERRGH